MELVGKSCHSRIVTAQRHVSRADTSNTNWVIQLQQQQALQRVADESDGKYWLSGAVPSSLEPRFVGEKHDQSHNPPDQSTNYLATVPSIVGSTFLEGEEKRYQPAYRQKRANIV